MTASASTIAAEARAIHLDRHAAAHVARARNQSVIGVIGSAIPKEIILAAGAFPLTLDPRVEDHLRDCTPMESEHEAEVRSLFLQATNGLFAVCDAIVIASTSDAYRYLFQYLTEMRRTGQGAALPPIWLYDFLFGPAASVVEYDRIVMTKLVAQIEALGGAPVSESVLDAAILRTDAVRRELTKLDALRLDGRVDGPDAMALIGAGSFIEPEAHAALLRKAIGEASVRERRKRPRLLVATAVPLYHDRLHRAVNEAGADIVAEDDALGARAGGPPIETGDAPLERLLAHYRAHDANPRQVGAHREAWLRGAMAGPVDAIVFYLPPDDQSFGWRYPALAEAAAAAGKPSLLIRDDALDPDGYARIVSAILDWDAINGDRWA